MSEDKICKPERRLPPEAYEVMPGDQYPSYVPAEQIIPEFTFKAVLVGSALGVLFGAANAYLGLKVGLTVSASIPAAVMSVAFFRIFGGATILENNIVQTIGSSGEGLAAGVIFTLPALLLLGFDLQVVKIFTLALLGGWLGIFFMIPLRRYLISREHGKLLYPEGTACAEVLVAGDEGGSRARIVFMGLGLGAVYEFLMSGMGLWKNSPVWNIPKYQAAQISCDVSPSLLGVGYVIGPRISAIMLGGGALSWLVFIPAIALFGKYSLQPVFPATEPISSLSPDRIWHFYIRYIGAGAVACGGLITLARSVPTIVESFREGLKGLLARENGKLNLFRVAAVKRTEQDLPLMLVLIASLVIAVAIWLMPKSIIDANLLTSVLIVIFAFFFVTVSSRIVGLIGSSSNPISGMTIATLLFTSLIFVALGWTDRSHQAVALSVGAVVCLAAAMAGDCSQDLKTGFLVGATPRHQQVAELIGVLVPAAIIGWIVLRLHQGIGIGSRALPAPQPTLMSLVVKGVLSGELPWGLVLIGVFLAGIMEVLGIPALPFAVGVYLPFSTSVSVFAGGAIRYFSEKIFCTDKVQDFRESGVLYASGLIGGSAFVGMALGLLKSFDFTTPIVDFIHLPSHLTSLKPLWDSDWLALILFLGLCYSLWWIISRGQKKKTEPAI